MADLDLIQSYIAFKSPALKRFIFVSDPSGIMPVEGELYILNRYFKIVLYETDLQLRSELEAFKDSAENRNFCIVSSKTEQENILISDYIARSNYVKITPQSVMEFAQGVYNWTEELNQLKGNDFWNLFEKLKRLRESRSGPISSRECVYIMLSAILDLDLFKPLSVSSAIELQKRLETDENLIHMSNRYPDLIRELKKKIQEVLPIVVKVEHDKDLIKFLWLSYSLHQHTDSYELIISRVLGQDIWQRYGNIQFEKVAEICKYILSQETTQSIEQIKSLEDWLTEEEDRVQSLKTWIGLSNVQKSISYAAKESYLCLTTKEALRVIARALVSSSEPIMSTQQRSDILKNINSRHLFNLDDTDYMHIRDTFREFDCLCELLNLMNEVKKKEWWSSKEARTDIHIWTQEIYPNYLSRFELLRDKIETLNFKCDLLTPSLLEKITKEANSMLSTFNESFTLLIKERYCSWVAKSEKYPIFVTDFINEIFKPFFAKYKGEASNVYIIIFDGMRWDEWELLKPRILKIFQGKMALEDVIPLLSILPSTTEWTRKSIFAGTFPKYFVSQNEDELLGTALGLDGSISIKMSGEQPEQREFVASFIEEERQIKPIIFSLIDIKAHSSKQNLVTLYEEVEVNFNNTIQPFLEKIQPDSLVFILSDHGFVELVGKGIVAPDREIADPHRRYVVMKNDIQDNGLLSSEFVFFRPESINMPYEQPSARYGFAKPGRFLISVKEQQSGRTLRYAHGGISMQEMIVPCAVFTPKAKGQLTIF